jgi:ribonuclease D
LKTLSKTHQCSYWEARPLSSAQIEYAGLDAAILLALVAEKAYCDENEEFD